MCKEAIGQRAEIERMLKSDLQRCVQKIRHKGECEIPSLTVDLENLFIANRKYFEQQGFFFELDTPRFENNRIKYFACIVLGSGTGELGAHFWKKIREAQSFFVDAQREEIAERLKKARGQSISVDMRKLRFENKLYFEGMGYVFEPEIRQGDDTSLCYTCRKKKRS